MSVLVYFIILSILIKPFKKEVCMCHLIVLVLNERKLSICLRRAFS